MYTGQIYMSLVIWARIVYQNPPGVLWVSPQAAHCCYSLMWLCWKIQMDTCDLHGAKRLSILRRVPKHFLHSKSFLGIDGNEFASPEWASLAHSSLTAPLAVLLAIQSRCEWLQSLFEQVLLIRQRSLDLLQLVFIKGQSWHVKHRLYYIRFLHFRTVRQKSL